MYFLAKTSLFVVLAVQFLLTAVQFVLFLLDWALSAAEQGLEPLRYYLALFSERERYAPEQMAMMEEQLMQFRTVRWWRQAMDYGPSLGRAGGAGQGDRALARAGGLLTRLLYMGACGLCSLGRAGVRREPCGCEAYGVGCAGGGAGVAGPVAEAQHHTEGVSVGILGNPQFITQIGSTHSIIFMSYLHNTTPSSQSNNWYTRFSTSSKKCTPPPPSAAKAKSLGHVVAQRQSCLAIFRSDYLRKQ